MIKNKQVNREAKQLFRLCRVNFSVDEDRVRQVVKHVITSDRRNSHAILYAISPAGAARPRPAYG